MVLIATHHNLGVTTPSVVTVPYNPSLGHQPMGGALLMAPGIYRQYDLLPNGTLFQCAVDYTLPGLYQSFFPLDEPGGSWANLHNRIVAGGNPLALASAVAALHVFGTVDSAMSVAGKITKMINSPVSCQCGETADVLVSLAGTAGIPVRKAYPQTAETPNNYFDGHVIVEMKVNGVWKAFDASLNFVFRDATTGDLMNLVEAVEGMASGQTTFQCIAPFIPGYQTSAAHAWNPFGWLQSFDSTNDAARFEAAKRVYQMPFVAGPSGAIAGFTPPGTEGRANWVAAKGFTVMTRSAFMAQYYP
jgi:hypothetical protein